MAASITTTRIAPLMEGLMENSYAREKLRDGATRLGDAYERSQKRRVKAARDEKLRSQLRAAVHSIDEGAKALASGRKKPKRRWGRRLLFVLVLGAVAGGIALAADEDLRNSIVGGESERDQP